MDETNKTNIDTAVLGQAADKVGQLAVKVQNLIDLEVAIEKKLEIRVEKNYDDYFAKLRAFKATLDTDISNLDSLKTRINQEIVNADNTNKQTENASDEATNYDEMPNGYEEGAHVEEPEGGHSEEPPKVENENVDPGVSTVVPGIATGAAAATGGVEAISEDEVDPTVVEKPHKYIGTVTDPLEEYHITKEDWDDLSDEDKEAIVKKLEAVGFTDDEIKDIENGNGVLPKVVISDVATALEDLYATDPSIREKLTSRYGFDVFYDDGTVNPTKLGLALLIDAKNSNDGYDLISLLAKDYNIDLVDMGNLTVLMDQIQSALKVNPELRDQLIAKYGMDIFNADGSINQDKLRYLLMIDGFDSIDNFNMVNSLYDCYGINIDGVGAIDELSMMLADAALANPQLRQKIIDRYGIDIFNPDGTINQDKLKYVLMLDTMDGDNKFDLMSLLTGDATNGIVANETIDTINKLLTDNLAADPNLREELIARYGFDIFDADGTVNMDRLRYALMLDSMSKEDDFDLLKYLTDTYGEKAPEVEEETTSHSNVGTILAGVAMAAGAGGAGYAYYKKRKKEDEEEEDSDEIYYDDSDI